MIRSEAVQSSPKIREARFDSTRPGDRPQLQLVRKVEVDRSRDALLTDFGKTTLEDRYLLPGESYQDMFARVATASISIICGGTSAGIEPIPANIYTHKTLSGSFAVKNPYLEKVLAEKGLDTDVTWRSILEHEGSVQHLDGLTDDEKDVFKTAFELDQRWVIELAADRTPEICQSQSLNVFLPGDTDKWDLHMLHYSAWERGVKSLYYLRSKSVQRASFAGGAVPVDGAEITVTHGERVDYDECLACQ